MHVFKFVAIKQVFDELRVEFKNETKKWYIEICISQPYSKRSKLLIINYLLEHYNLFGYILINHNHVLTRSERKKHFYTLPTVSKITGPNNFLIKS